MLSMLSGNLTFVISGFKPKELNQEENGGCNFDMLFGHTDHLRLKP